MSIDLSQLTLMRARQDLDGAMAGLGTSSASDPLKFRTMLASRLGIDGQVLGAGEAFAGKALMQDLSGLGLGEGASTDDAVLGLSGLGAGLSGLGGDESFGDGLGGMNMLKYNALHTLAKIADTTPTSVQAAAQSAALSGTDAAGSNEVRRSVVKNAVRMVVNSGARHPDDLGHLTRAAKGENAGFTQSEEELFMAAAKAENSLEQRMQAESKVQGAATGPVLASSLERSAGSLSSRYESGGAIDCIGYDKKGGTSYGQYQIASKTGTMENFIKFLDDKAPDIATRLKNAGPSDTGGKTGSMPEEWKEIASEDPKRFEALQHEFIRVNNYSPAAKSIVLTSGVDVNSRSHALREVLWSTAVQHGPNGAERIFSKAIETAQTTKTGQDFDKAVIEEVYSIRQRQFGSHGRRIREAVTARFQDEKSSAIAMLDQTAA
ncbi:hypothetical protein G3N56_15080 [Desulfovibrio sulfodismutans]|uniref:Type VI secretion system spike protein VgrG3-like C-terminal domain-containing protein n=1 Tax=Desulfolutivibrio sulfodismutans TaxID=63561 RepID=A0A7K3NPM5_9BACT|nr:hypothetical protein [Desulfolutivibrio sulfodismutans]NDY58057.1 hypothetical protein [Desulfolutivibrio sulfodismutans]QLA13650.1 hypothetical protein GD606_15955 [Desulfolutivibrio sulfodismutans DSM 3696]